MTWIEVLIGLTVVAILVALFGWEMTLLGGCIASAGAWWALRK